MVSNPTPVAALAYLLPSLPFKQKLGFSALSPLCLQDFYFYFSPLSLFFSIDAIVMTITLGSQRGIQDGMGKIHDRGGPGVGEGGGAGSCSDDHRDDIRAPKL